jgi:outer membrane protein assembly factor BamA
MRLKTLLLLFALCAGPAASQNAAFPLESVTIEGSAVPQSAIMEIAGLRIATPIDKAAIEQACKELQESGLFASISYRYAPGPKKGYALTLILADQVPLSTATIDIPGTDENEIWQWLTAKFQRFDHQAPQVDAAQKYLANQIEQHLGSRMRGQHLTVRMETDLKTHKLSLSFQPEVLPRIRSVTFSGNQALASAELGSVLNPIVLNQEYTERKFAAAIEMNLRPVYEQHAFYRVAFAPGSPQLSETGVSMNVAITEGAQYQLGKVDLIGENLPVNAMLSAGKLPKGKLANWKQIQEGLWEMEKVVKRSGFFEASSSPDRSYDDATHVLDLRISISKGPLYHFGELQIEGLSPELQERARRIWQPKRGDPYDYAYPNEFFQAFSRIVDFRDLRKYDAVVQKRAGDHVMDIKLIFESR